MTSLSECYMSYLRVLKMKKLFSLSLARISSGKCKEEWPTPQESAGEASSKDEDHVHPVKWEDFASLAWWLKHEGIFPHLILQETTPDDYYYRGYHQSGSRCVHFFGDTWYVLLDTSDKIEFLQEYKILIERSSEDYETGCSSYDDLYKWCWDGDRWWSYTYYYWPCDGWFGSHITKTYWDFVYEEWTVVDFEEIYGLEMDRILYG